MAVSPPDLQPVRRQTWIGAGCRPLDKAGQKIFEAGSGRKQGVLYLTPHISRLLLTNRKIRI
jgi:hypothetical protein